MDGSHFLWMILSFVFFLKVADVAGNDLDRCPRNLPHTPHLKTFKEKCYEFHNEERSWYSARDVCHSRGGWLVQILDWQIQSFIHNSLRSLNWNRNGVWLGAHDLDNEGEWKWVQGYPLTFTNWAHDQPGGCQIIFVCVEDCANLRLDDNGKWHDYPCDIEPYSYICEYTMLPPTTTTTTTTTPSPTTRTTTLAMTSTNASTSTQPVTSTTSTTLPPSPTPPSTTPEVSTTTSLPDHCTSLSTKSESATTTSASTTLQSTSTTPSARTTKTTTATSETTTTSSGNGGQSLQQGQIVEKGGLTHGEVAGLAISLLLIAFLSGVVCTYVLIKRRRKNKRLSTEGCDSARYIVDPSRQPHVDDTRLVLNILYSANVPESPPKYEEIDHSRGTRDQPNGSKDVFAASGFRGSNDKSLAGRPPSYTSDTCAEKSVCPYYDTADGAVSHEKFSKSSSASGHDSYLYPSGTISEKSKGKLSLAVADDSYETPRDCSPLYKKVTKKQQTTDASKCRFDEPSTSSKYIFDDAIPKEHGENAENDDDNVDVENVYCVMLDVNRPDPDPETENLNDSVYEEPISVKDLQSAHKSKEKDDQMYVQSDWGAIPGSKQPNTGDVEGEIDQGTDLVGNGGQDVATQSTSKTKTNAASENTYTFSHSDRCDEVIPSRTNEENDAMYDDVDDQRGIVEDDYLMVCDDVVPGETIQGIDNPIYTGVYL